MSEPSSDAPIRVLHVITGLAAGGAEDQLRLLLPLLRGHGVSSEVAVFYNAGSVATALRAEGIPVTDLESPGFWDWRGTARLTGLIRAGNYDLVHTHLFRAGLHGRVAARRDRARLTMAERSAALAAGWASSTVPVPSVTTAYGTAGMPFALSRCGPVTSGRLTLAAAR